MMEAAFPIMLTLHLLGVVIGMGAANVADLLFFSFLRDFTISKKESSVLRTLARMILGAIVVICITGAALFAAKPEVYATSPHFIAKMIIVAVVACNGAAMHIWIAPHMVEISFRGRSTARLKQLRRLAFVLGAISIISWYASFLIAMLKKSLLLGVSLSQLLSAYLMVLIFGIVVGQCMERSLSRRAKSLSSR